MMFSMMIWWACNIASLPKKEDDYVLDMHFNLTTAPWLNVLTQDGQIESRGMLDVFQNANRYQRLYGDMRTQDLVLLRLLLSVLYTVYSRVDADGKPYDWLTLDGNMQIVDAKPDMYEAEDVFDTWKVLWQRQSLGQPVLDYLEKNVALFNADGDRPFMQVTPSQYDQYVDPKKKLDTGSGTVPFKTLNRRVSESNNSPNVFNPRTGSTANELNGYELMRWLIMYGQYSGTSDKSHVVDTEKVTSDAGWMYKLSPVYVRGRNLVQTLLLNLKLTVVHEPAYVAEMPLWEQSIDDYVSWRKTRVMPDNLATLYTYSSRMMCLYNGEIYVAALPTFVDSAVLAEPMTMWRHKDNTVYPYRRQKTRLGEKMWRNYSTYSSAIDDPAIQTPGIVLWMQYLNTLGIITDTDLLELTSCTLIDNATATSQTPVYEWADDLTASAAMVLNTSVHGGSWPSTIASAVTFVQGAGKGHPGTATYYRGFTHQIGVLRSIDKSDGASVWTFGNQSTDQYFSVVDAEFKQWLRGLRVDMDPATELSKWQDSMRELTLQLAAEFLKRPSQQDLRGTVDNDTGAVVNVFSLYGQLRGSLKKLGSD